MNEMRVPVDPDIVDELKEIYCSAHSCDERCALSRYNYSEEEPYTGCTYWAHHHPEEALELMGFTGEV